MLATTQVRYATGQGVMKLAQQVYLYFQMQVNTLKAMLLVLSLYLAQTLLKTYTNVIQADT